VLIAVLIFLAGLVALSWSADRFVYGASALAKNIGVSPMIIGLTIVAMGSSAPEIMVSATASLGGNVDTAVGNALGSNIANIALVLGMTALLKPIIVSSQTLRREMPLLLAVTLLAVYLLMDDFIAFYEGSLLIALFFAMIGLLTWLSLKARKDDPLQQKTEEEVPTDVPTYQAVLWVIVGLLMLPFSAHFIVESAVTIAKYFGLSDLVIGLTIIALGTSLPELAASIAGVLKNEDDLAMGNIIGSNIFNILAVLAMPGIIAPGAIDPLAASRDSYIMLGITLLLLLFSFSFYNRKRSVNRLEGFLLFSCYIAYQISIFQ
jgi:cation:H+ antiporter